MGKKKDLEDKEVVLVEKPEEVGKSEDSVREIVEAFDEKENTITELEEKEGETTLVALVPIGKIWDDEF